MLNKVNMESLIKKKFLNIINENHRVPRNSNLVNVEFKSDAHQDIQEKTKP